MAYPYPKYTIQNTITPGCDISGGTTHCDISGAPVYSPHSQGVYFAVSARGNLNGQYSNGNYYNIFVGSTDLAGNVVWVKTFGKTLQPNKNAWNPYLVTGPNDEVFLVYSTDGVIRTGFRSGVTDTIFARIDVVAGVPQVIWAKQNNYFNTVFDDTYPVLAIDTTFRYVYLTWTVTSNTAKQIYLSCFDFQGTQLWILLQPPYSVDYINNSGVNRMSAITTDNNGNVYIAYETSGTRTINNVIHPIPYQQVDVVKLKTVAGLVYTYNYEWTLSQELNTGLWASDGYCYKPSILYTQDRLVLSFLTSGTIRTHTDSELDIVVAAISTGGDLYWVRQGLPYSLPIQNIYQTSLSAEAPYIYISAITNTQTTRDSVLAWKLNNFDGTLLWNYARPTDSLSAYGYACTGVPNAVFDSASYSFLFTSIQAAYGRLYLSAFTLTRLPGPPVVIVPPRWFTLSELGERNYAIVFDAYSYLTLDCRNSCV